MSHNRNIKQQRHNKSELIFILCLIHIFQGIIWEISLICWQYWSKFCRRLCFWDIDKRGTKAFVSTRPCFVCSYPQAISPLEVFHTLTEGEDEEIKLSVTNLPQIMGHALITVETNANSAMFRGGYRHQQTSNYLMALDIIEHTRQST
jgi:hypothetical protein